jgi:hypothetical protein
MYREIVKITGYIPALAWWTESNYERPQDN